MSHTGDTSTSQLSPQARAARFLVRTRVDLAQMRYNLPRAPQVISVAAAEQIERLAHKVSATAEPFGFPEIGAIAGAIELIAHECAGRKPNDRGEFMARLSAQLGALDEHLNHADEEIRATGTG